MKQLGLQTLYRVRVLPLVGKFTETYSSLHLHKGGVSLAADEALALFCFPPGLAVRIALGQRVPYDQDGLHPLGRIWDRGKHLRPLVIRWGAFYRGGIRAVADC